MSLPNRRLMDWLVSTLTANPLTLTELDLLRGWHRQHEQPVAIDTPYELFKQHFEMRNALYHLKQTLAGDYHLELGLLYIRLHPASDAGQSVSQPDSLAAYYLNASNLTNETPDSVAAMLEGFFQQWQRFQVADVDQASQVLAVANPNDLQEIKQQYRKLAHQHHPDKGGNPDTFKRVQQAYQVLKAANR